LGYILADFFTKSSGHPDNFGVENLLWPFGILCGHLLYSVAVWYISSHLVIFLPCWYLASRKFWQPWLPRTWAMIQ
jgi:hypothetical protein